MKTNRFFYLAVLFSATVALASCTEEFDFKWERVNKGSGVNYHEAQIIASNPSEDEIETKAYIESDGAGGYLSKWNSDDQISLFQKNSVDGYKPKITSKKTDISLSNSDRTASFAVTLAETVGAENYKYWAVYPDGAATRSSEDLNLVIPQTQTFTANMFDKAADVMISEPVERAAFSAAALEMGFARVGTVVKMTLKGLTVGETLKSVTFSTSETGKYLAGTVKYDLANDELKSGISSGKQTLTLDAGESIVVPASGNVDVWFRTTEVTLTENFTVIAYTRDAGLQNYSYTKAVDLAASSKTLAFRSGRLATFGVSGLGSGKETLEYDPLIPEGYYVLHVVNADADYDKAIANTCAGSGFLDAVDNPFTPDGSGKYNASANPELLWKVDFDEDNNKYSFYSIDSEKYMSGNLNNSSELAEWFYMGANSGDYTGTYSIYDGATFASAKHIGYNYNSGTNPRFKFYAAPITNYPGYITFTPAYGTPTLSFPVTSKNVSASTTSVVFYYTSLFLSDDPVVAVTSDTGSAVADTYIDDGTLTVTLNENTAAISKSISLTVSATGATPVVLNITQAAAVGDASIGDVLWAESFGGFAADDVPTEGNASTTVYGSSSVSYSCVNGNSNTRIMSDSTAGGTSPEILIGSDGGSFTVSNIPTGNATGMTLTFKSNKGCVISTGTSGVSIGPNLGSYTYAITLDSAKPTISLTFTNSDAKNNTRVDDFMLLAGAPVPGITVATRAATAISSATGTTATLNGSLTLVNGAINSSVTEAGFYYKLTSAGSYTKVTCASAPTSTTSFSYDLTGLTKDVEYTYYAYAVYDDGDDVTGSTTTFTPTQSGAVSTVTYTWTLPWSSTTNDGKIDDDAYGASIGVYKSNGTYNGGSWTNDSGNHLSYFSCSANYGFRIALPASALASGQSVSVNVTKVFGGKPGSYTNRTFGLKYWTNKESSVTTVTSTISATGSGIEVDESFLLAAKYADSSAILYIEIYPTAAGNSGLQGTVTVEL